MVLIKFAATTFFTPKRTTCTMLTAFAWAFLVPCFSLPSTPQKLQHVLLNESNGMIERNGIERIDDQY
jgi:hypothetical protein